MQQKTELWFLRLCGAAKFDLDLLLLDLFHMREQTPNDLRAHNWVFVTRSQTIPK
jgi:hypothetical protein